MTRPVVGPPGTYFRVSGFGFRVSGFGFQVYGEREGDLWGLSFRFWGQGLEFSDLYQDNIKVTSLHACFFRARD
jgi:hypothetical protein